MEDHLSIWWKKLSHNEKKIFLTNYDFANSKTEIKTYSDLYSQYKTTFGIGIRQRLDNFIPTKKNIKEILDQQKLTINHISFLNLSILENFENLQELYYQNCKIENIEHLKNTNLKTLKLNCESLNCLKSVCLTQIENISLINCYKLNNIDILKECINLKNLDLSHFGNRLKMGNLTNIDVILLNKNLIYPNALEYSLYRDKFEIMHKFLSKHIFNRKYFYTFNSEETDYILKNGFEYQKTNYLELIMSKKYSVYINSFTEWTLKKNSR